MVTLYRIVHYTNQTLLNWQGTSDDFLALSKIPGLTPRVSKLSSSFERGYYSYLRGASSANSEREAQNYFVTHFSIPEIQILVFKGNRPLPERLSSRDWEQFIAMQIRNRFEKLHLPVTNEGDNGRYSIYSDKEENKLKLDEELYVRRGVSFYIKLDDNNFPLIFTDVTHRIEYKGHVVKETSFRKFASSEALVRYKDFTALATDKIVEICENFISSLPKPVAETCEIEPRLCLARDIDFETWLWAHHMPLQLELGGGYKVSLAQSISEESEIVSGLYKQPESQIAVFFIYPSNQLNQWTKIRDWSPIQDLLETSLRAMLPGKDVPIKRLEYGNETDEANIVENIKEELKHLAGRRIIFAVVSPPNEDSTYENSDLRRINQFTGVLTRGLRKLQKGSYSITLDWEKLGDSIEQKWTVENEILKSLTVLGAIPWRVVGIPFDNNLSAEDVCFVGVDINKNKSVPRVGGVVVDGYGIVRGYHMVKLPSEPGDFIEPTAFVTLVAKLLNHYRDVLGHYPKHVVIHRDGLVTPEDCQIKEWFSEQKLEIDLLEIRKSGAPRLRQPANVADTPSRDIAVGNLYSQEAYLMTTFVLREKLTYGEWIFRSPEPIAIRRVVGKSSLKILAAQVYALTLANYNSYRRTTRLPITIAYADSLVNTVNMNPDFEDSGNLINSKTTLNWL